MRFAARFTHGSGHGPNEVLSLIHTLDHKYTIAKALAVNHIVKDKKPHTHLILDITDHTVTIQQLRYHFKKIFSGQAQYKLSEHKEISDKAYSYMFHHSEDPDQIIFSKNISREFMENILELNRNIKTIWKEAKAEKKSTISKLEEEVTTILLNKFSKNELATKISTPWGDALITRIVLQHRYVSPFELTRVITKIQYNIAKECDRLDAYSNFIYQYYRSKKFEDHMGNPIPPQLFSEDILNALPSPYQEVQIVPPVFPVEEVLQEEE